MKSFKEFSIGEPTTYVFVGDIMQHPHQLKFESGRGFSYKGVFEEVQPILDQGDYVIGNLETVLTNNFEMPNFRSGRMRAPIDFGRALANAGFTHLCTKNNHCYDFGVDGFNESVKIIKKCGITPITESCSVGCLDVLNFSTYFNCSKSDKGKHPGHVLDREEIQGGILNNTVVSNRMKMAFVHWGQPTGEQYNLVPLPDQLDTNADLVNYGYTLIVGAGPHSINKTIMDDGVLTAYSLGDFLSAHQKEGTTNEGKILVVKIHNKKIIEYKEYKTETETSTVQDNGKSIIRVK